MNGLAALLGLYTRSVYHRLIPLRWKTYLPLLALIALGLSLLSVEFIAFRRVFQALYNLQDLPFFFVQALLERLVGLIFLVSYSMIFMSSMINGLSSFFLSRNLPFLYTLPVSRWKVLVTKFLENWLTSCYLIVLFLFCFLLSHAHTYQMQTEHYLRFSLLLALFTLSPVAFGSTIVVILIRFFPVRRIHQVVTFMGIVFLGALMIAVRMMKPERLMNPADTDDFVRLIEDLTIPSLSHLPSSWASRVVVYGDYSHMGVLLLFTIGTIGLLAAVLWLFYETAFVYSQESRSLRNTRASRNPGSANVGATGALIRKDVKLFLRDATQWSQLMLLGALVVVYLLNIKNLAIQANMVRWVVGFINLGLASFVIAALSVRFLFPSVSMEGRAFWIIRTLPISFRRLLWVKYFIYFVPFLLFGEVLVYFSNRILNVDPFFMRISLANMLASSFALTGLAIGIGALIPNFKTDHPSQIAIGPGGVLYMLLSFLYIAAMMLLQVRPLWHYIIHDLTLMDYYFYPTAALLLTLLVGFVPMEWGARKLRKYEM